MSLTEERMQILKMLEEGVITAEEAAKLLAALEESAKAGQEPEPARSAAPKKRRVRICVTDGVTGKQKKINVHVPIGMVKMVRKMGGKFPTDIGGVNIDDILNEIGEETEGKVFEARDDELGKRVEIFVE